MPPVKLTDVLAATSIANGILQYESILPGGSGAGKPVLATSAIKIRFDRLLLPMTATRQAVCLQSKLGVVANATACAQGLVLEPSYDPMRREITYRLGSDNPTLPPVRHELTVYAAILDTDTGVRSFDGIPLDMRKQVEFEVSSQTGTPPDVLTTSDHFCTAPDPTCTAANCPRPVSLILGGCTLAGCHGRSNPPEGMDLSSVASILGTAINRTAHETETGEAAATAEPSSLRFGRSMPILDPTVPGESYLLYKLLANRKLLLDVPFTKAPDAGPGDDQPEVARLRAELVVGMPMPPDDGASAELLPATTVPHVGEAEWLSEWVLQGAPTMACTAQ